MANLLNEVEYLDEVAVEIPNLTTRQPLSNLNPLKMQDAGVAVISTQSKIQTKVVEKIKPCHQELFDPVLITRRKKIVAFSKMHKVSGEWRVMQAEWKKDLFATDVNGSKEPTRVIEDQVLMQNDGRGIIETKEPHQDTAIVVACMKALAPPNSSENADLAKPKANIVADSTYDLEDFSINRLCKLPPNLGYQKVDSIERKLAISYSQAQDACVELGDDDAPSVLIPQLTVLANFNIMANILTRNQLASATARPLGYLAQFLELHRGVKWAKARSPHIKDRWEIWSVRKKKPSTRNINNENPIVMDGSTNTPIALMFTSA